MLLLIFLLNYLSIISSDQFGSATEIPFLDQQRGTRGKS